MFSVKRPLEIWSTTADCFAATIGWLMVMCEVEITPEVCVNAEMPAAQV
jgi:hypothetical protein